MTPEEIKKKAYEKYPVKMDVEYDSWGNAEDVDLNARRRQGYIEAYKEISALPTIKGWVARDKDEEHATLWDSKPTRETTVEYWAGFGEWLPLPESSFPSLRWEDEPREVEIIIKTK